MPDHRKHPRSNSSGRLLPHWLALIASAALALPAHSQSSFTTFESGQVRPLALSPDGSRLFAVNTPDNRVEIFLVTETGLRHTGSVPVGLEPVALAARSNGQVWVVNHLSDSVSVISWDSGGAPPRVIRTLRTGDEPRDIVFGGVNRDKVFVTAAHRGQSSGAVLDPLVSKGRADVWMFDARDLDATPQVITLFGDAPRPLAVSPNGRFIYAGILNSGNRTTVMSRNTVLGDLPAPVQNVEGAAAPTDVGLIVKYIDGTWRDGADRDWTHAVRLGMPDWDVFAIDTSFDPPRIGGIYAGVGTTLFNIAVNPVSAAVYVSNTEALNQVRFEGPGEFSPTTVRGHFVENRITVIDGNEVIPRHLNKHIDYGSFPGTQQENDASLATPLGMAVSSDGSTLYVAAFGSGKIGVFDTAELEDDTFAPNPASHIELSGGGPSGLVLDEARGRMYVLTRFDNAISVVDLDAGLEKIHVPMYNPEPASVVDGRRFLYDARLTSSRGDSSCAGCHVFGDTDHLPWDLGNPDGAVVANFNPLALPLPPGTVKVFHPMKGPMTTQSLRGMANHGPMHWRGDRTGATIPGGDAFDENAAFLAFNGAFEGLIGREAPLSEAEMQAFADFALQISYPPNPVRKLDNSLRASEANGLEIYSTRLTDGQQSCIDCHALNQAAGFFGTRGLSVIRANMDGSLRQSLKIPHLRNLYTKVGFFGSSRTSPTDPFVGDQIRGSGFGHDGAEDTIFNFLSDFENMNDEEVRDVVDFLMAFDSNLAPVVGQQVTVRRGNLSQERPRLLTLLNRSAVTQPIPECDLVTKGNYQGEMRGTVRLPNGKFRADRASAAEQTLQQMLSISLIPGGELTFTCVPPGSGTRIGIDRDEDGYYDRDELDAGSDPADPNSIPQ